MKKVKCFLILIRLRQGYGGLSLRLAATAKQGESLGLIPRCSAAEKGPGLALEFIPID